MYKIKNMEFSTFEEVKNWAWEYYLISFDGELASPNMPETMMQDACAELNTILSEMDI